MDSLVIEKYEEIAKLARDVLVLSRNTLLVNLRFLDMALSQLPYIQATTTITTDGKYLYFDPVFVLNDYKEEKEQSVRGYLHIIMHCILRHMYVHTLINKRLWNISCDIAVESIIEELDIKSTITVNNSEKEEIIKELKDKVQLLTAEKLYNYFLNEKISNLKISRIEKLFRYDDHAIWYMSEDEKFDSLSLAREERTSATSKNNHGAGNLSGSSESTASDDENLESNSSLSAQENFWKNVSERMQQDIENFNNSKLQGKGKGNMLQNLKEVNREKYDYTSFLKKFAIMGEAMKINDDEFDYIFYTYGLNKYGNMPLIEPLEYKEVKRIRDFVIAIDTSGSTSGELVQAFLQKTYNVLMSTESFFSKINLHIIQCDADIQEDAKITCKNDFERYLKRMKIKGLGGTDFRPVFEYVDELIEKKEFMNLKGLIYFTDGFGTFPEKMPDYKTAFVFIKEDYELPEIPPWAIKLILQKQDI